MLDVPDAVDLAIIIVPKEYVKETAIQCGEKGVKGLVVISAGFSEVGEEGRKREQELLEVVREYGMRMIGPNGWDGILIVDALVIDASINPGNYGGPVFNNDGEVVGIVIVGCGDPAGDGALRGARQSPRRNLGI